MARPTQPRPSYSLNVDGRDITPIVQPRLIDMTLTEERGTNADQLDLEIDDSDGAVPLPARGKIISVAIGWAGEYLIDKGRFVIDDVEHSGAPDRITIRARSADLRASLTRKTEQSWHGRTMGEIVTEIAARNNLLPVIAPDFAAVAMPHIDQTDESDINFIDRLARQFDAVATVKWGRLLFMPAGAGRTLSGHPLDFALIERQSGDSHRFTVADREAYTGVRASYYDTDGATKHDVEYTGTDDTRPEDVPVQPSAENMKSLRHVYSDRSAALRAARSEWHRIQREMAQFSITLAHGRPDIAPETPAICTGFKKGIDGAWLIYRCRHSLNNQGLTSTLDLEARS